MQSPLLALVAVEEVLAARPLLVPSPWSVAMAATMVVVVVD
jgi:hypothetical protein